jgi:hypothetical protein
MGSIYLKGIRGKSNIITNLSGEKYKILLPESACVCEDVSHILITYLL